MQLKKLVDAYDVIGDVGTQSFENMIDWTIFEKGPDDGNDIDHEFTQPGFIRIKTKNVNVMSHIVQSFGNEFFPDFFTVFVVPFVCVLIHFDDHDRRPLSYNEIWAILRPLENFIMCTHWNIMVFKDTGDAVLDASHCALKKMFCLVLHVQNLLNDILFRFFDV